MNITKLFTIKNLAILIIVLSLSANLFYFGREFVRNQKQKYLNLGAGQLQELIYNAAVKNNEVIIKNSEGKEIILEVKK